jgi:hypothetical protein
MVTSPQVEDRHANLNYEKPPAISTDIFTPNDSRSLPFSSFDPLNMSQQTNLNHLDGMQTSLTDYNRTAEEMSHFLTWDASEWSNFGGQNQF